MTQPSASNKKNYKQAVYTLKKRRPGCTGMFWRSDPTGKSRVASNSDWPRDNAQLRGIVVDVNGVKWLAVSQVKQADARAPPLGMLRKGKWKPAPQGAYMPFEYNDHYYLE